MLLVDHQILQAMDEGLIQIDPFENWMLQPASIDIQFGTEVKLFKTFSGNKFIGDEPLDLYDPINAAHDIQVVPLEHENAFFALEPGELILASTKQAVKMAPTIMTRIDGKSSIGRHGVLVHVTAGNVDPGFEGQLTLEIVNLNHRPIILRPGMPIAQLSFIRLAEAPKFPYGTLEAGSHYQGQRGATSPQPLRRRT